LFNLESLQHYGDERKILETCFKQYVFKRCLACLIIYGSQTMYIYMHATIWAVIQYTA